MLSRSLITLCALALPLTAAARGYLENPQPGAVESGLGVISGWHCTASRIEAFIDGRAIGSTGVGSVRDDTTEVCGHNESGFALLYNYNISAPGPHEITVYADGVQLDKRRFHSLRSGGIPFLSGKQASTTVDNFPTRGRTTVLEWSEAKQSFVVAGSYGLTTLDGNYRLRRASLQTENFGLLDTEDVDGIQVSGTMRLSGNSYRQDLEFRSSANAPASPIRVRGEVVDMGFYLYDRINGSQLVVVERGAAVITSFMYREAELGWTNEIQYWVKTD